MTIVTEWFEQFNCPPLTPLLWQQGQIALLEGFTNAVLHAHHNLSPITPIEFVVEISPKIFKISIWDRGNEYDIGITFQHLSQHLSNPDFNPLERESQWGSIMLLKLINEYDWQIRYIREADRNCLYIEKALLQPKKEL
ncbi:MAG: anti-sigma regulatory factor [Acaryochloridaceae cyanobacterium RU_4_10]|nr:anti-sigma regulatory factor [Acaryochloridaceae cyanobacterium RU_4_10]